MPSLLQNRLGSLIPAYWAVDSTRWDTVINTHNAFPDVPIAVVLNIGGGAGSSGGAGTSPISTWTNLISRLKSSNIIVLGYVDTEVAVPADTTINARTAAWKTNYPTIDGIFFDNLGIQTTHQTYNTTIANYAKTTQGFLTVAGNCKTAATTVETTWHSQTVPIDTFIVFDGSGLDPVDTSYSKYSALNNNQLGVIAFGVPAQDTSWNAQMSQYIGWIYVTTGTGTTPYNSFPGYFNDFISNLNTIGAGGGTGGGGTGGVTDIWGIRKLYHTKEGGEEFFTNQNDILADASTGGRIQNFEGENIQKESDGSHSSNGGSDNGDLRLEIWSPAYSNSTQRLAARWLNVEVTVYAKYFSQDGRDPPYAWQLYGKGGHHTTSRPCEGCAYKFRWWRTSDETSFDKELCHSNYAGNFNRTTGHGATGGFGNGQWHGTKLVQYNVSNGVKLELYSDVNCSDSNGNLVIKNNWKLSTSRVDSGGIGPGSLAECADCGRALTEILDEPYSVTDSGSVNYQRNLCAYRTDGVTTRFRYYSAREIDSTKPVTGDATTPPPPPAGTTDQWGIKKIYPTVTNGYEWYMNMTGANPNTDTTKFSMSAAVTKNADGSFKCTTAGPDMLVFQRNGYDSATTANAAGNHATLASRGYMQNATDWRNVECTIYVKLNATPTGGNFQWFTRGGRHLTPEPNCEGSSLRGELRNSGETICAKEQWHSLIAPGNVGVGTTNILNRWIGFKYMVTTKTVSGTVVTNQQIWLDPQNNNTWTKFDERTDAGGWGNQGAVCQGAADQLISWGGPIVEFDWLSFTDVDFKNMSVREIDANSVPAGSPPDSNPSLCGS